MNRSDHERLTDELIGEATLSLLKDNGPISMKLLLERLQQMLSIERDGQRRNVLSQIILEISTMVRVAPGVIPKVSSRSGTRMVDTAAAMCIPCLAIARKPTGISINCTINLLTEPV
ncbi:hypothetical protein [Leclercia sp. LTM14]|uniref:hypothetical protein n=1 Tax=Leclercia sp. LTM14 TaxID=2870869 RepID=UPI0020742ABD|nr:hypothetical protein [Leclercia sp. LTM14]MCM5699057.1 hypothetical protein [Leclercia sp. LTM14]